MTRPGSAVLAAGAMLLAQAAGAQSVSVAASRWFTDPHVTDYRVSIHRYGAGPFALRPFAQLTLQGPRSAGASLVGIGADGIVLLTGSARPYLIAGVSGGVFDFDRDLGLGLWSAWSAGAGYEVVRLGPVALGMEARYQQLSRERTGGLSLGVRLGAPLGRSRVDRPAPGTAPPPPGPERAPDGASPSPPAGDLARTVSDAAQAVMGTPYRWGGTDANGFDCSGLIVYAYAQVGIQVPRRSVDQAAAGRPVVPYVPDLAPGDILVFSATPGGRVSHVGLYLGDGRFVHSASGGVRVSRLSADDPDGRWWYERWVTARRVLAGE